jgi:hypothetical protein
MKVGGYPLAWFMEFSGGSAVFVSFSRHVKYTGDILLLAGMALEERGFDQQIPSGGAAQCFLRE